MWQTIRKILQFSFACAICASCSSIHDIPVGLEAGEPDLERCSGRDTRCEKLNFETTGVGKRRSVDCITTYDPPLHVAWTRNLDDVPCPPLGKCRASQVVLAADGTTWFVGWPIQAQRSGNLEGLQLGRYGARGEVIFETVIDSWTASRTSSWDHGVGDMPARPRPNILTLAVNAQGHALVGYTGATLAPDERVQRADPWVAEFDGKGKPAGNRVRLSGLDGGLMMLQNAPDGWLLTVTPRSPVPTDSGPPHEGPLTPAEEAENARLVAAFNTARLAKLDRMLNFVWVQTTAYFPDVALRIDTQGRLRTFVLDNDSLEWRAAVYDEHGNPSELLDLDSIDTRPHDMNEQGHAVIISAGVAPWGDPPWEVHRWLDGLEIMTTRIVEDTYGTVLNSAVAIDANDTVYVTATGRPSSEFEVLFRVDAAGQTCTFAELTGIRPASPTEPLGGLMSLSVAPSGEIYFSTFPGTIGQFTR